MISHTVYRGRNNAIELQLLSDGDPLAAPDIIDRVEFSLTAQDVHFDTDTHPQQLDYDNTDGSIVAVLGRVDEIAVLLNGNYMIAVTGYGASNVQGFAFGEFMIYLRDWGGEVPSGS